MKSKIRLPKIHNEEGGSKPNSVPLSEDPRHEMLSDVFSFSEMLRDDSYDVKIYADGSIYKGQFNHHNGKKH